MVSTLLRQNIFTYGLFFCLTSASTTLSAMDSNSLCEYGVEFGQYIIIKNHTEEELLAKYTKDEGTEKIGVIVAPHADLWLEEPDKLHSLSIVPYEFFKFGTLIQNPTNFQQQVHDELIHSNDDKVNIHVLLEVSDPGYFSHLYYPDYNVVISLCTFEDIYENSILSKNTLREVFPSVGHSFAKGEPHFPEKFLDLPEPGYAGIDEQLSRDTSYLRLRKLRETTDQEETPYIIDIIDRSHKYLLNKKKLEDNPLVQQLVNMGHVYSLRKQCTKLAKTHRAYSEEFLVELREEYERVLANLNSLDQYDYINTMCSCLTDEYTLCTTQELLVDLLRYIIIINNTHTKLLAVHSYKKNSKPVGATIAPHAKLWLENPERLKLLSIVPNAHSRRTLITTFANLRKQVRDQLERANQSGNGLYVILSITPKKNLSSTFNNSDRYHFKTTLAPVQDYHNRENSFEQVFSDVPNAISRNKVPHERNYLKLPQSYYGIDEQASFEAACNRFDNRWTQDPKEENAQHILELTRQASGNMKRRKILEKNPIAQAALEDGFKYSLRKEYQELATAHTIDSEKYLTEIEKAYHEAQDKLIPYSQYRVYKSMLTHLDIEYMLCTTRSLLNEQEPYPERLQRFLENQPYLY